MSEFNDRPELIKKRARAIWLLRMFWIFCGVVVVAIMILLTYNAIAATASRTAILDCTVPEGKCFQEGQERTAAVIKQLIDANRADEITTRRIVVAAAACAADLRSEGEEITTDAVQRCVDAELRNQGG